MLSVGWHLQLFFAIDGFIISTKIFAYMYAPDRIVFTTMKLSSPPLLVATCTATVRIPAAPTT